DTGTFDPGDIVTYNCTLTNVLVGFTNSATATGHPPTAPDVTGSDTADVFINAPGSPTVAKAPAATSSDSTNAYWNITITNNNALSQTVQIVDTGATLQSVTPVGACTPAPVSSGPWSCTVAGGAPGTTVLHVSRPLTEASWNGQTCTITNTATASWLVIGGGPAVAIGVTGSPSTITVANSHCVGSVIVHKVYTGATPNPETTFSGNLVPNTGGAYGFTGLNLANPKTVSNVVPGSYSI